MTSLPGRKRAQHHYERQGDDWYCEPDYTVRSLFDRVRFITGPVFDPCCGRGMIPIIAAEYGYEVGGSDIRRCIYGTGGIDFRTDNTRRKSLVFNPPFKDALAFILHALEVADEIAVLVKVQFESTQGRYHKLFKPHRPSFKLALPRRPSMPPGDVNQEAENGTDDYCWFGWGTSMSGPTVMDWAADPRGDRRGRARAEARR